MAAPCICTGTFGERELALLLQYGGTAHPVELFDPGLDVESIAHFFLSRLLDQLADRSAGPEQVLVLDAVRAGFLRNPFQSETIGLSVFHESPARIVDSDFDLYRLAMFTPAEGSIVQQPVVSSAALRGGLGIVRDFYRKLFELPVTKFKQDFNRRNSVALRRDEGRVRISAAH